MVIDTSVLFAFYAAFDPNHEEAVRALEQMRRAKETLIVPHEVVMELCSVLIYKSSLDDSLAAVEGILGDSLYYETDPLPSGQVVLLLKELGAPISYTDATVLLHGRNARQEILTFDRQMKSLWKKMQRA
ncbi:MAG: type II toxin-antitoxin system VapC family toxin [Candidatus Micrarchaeia archaeon]